MADNHEFKALGTYKEQLFKMICTDEKSDLLIDLLMPVLDDSRLDKIDNFLGGDYEINTGTGKQLIKLKGRLFDVPFVYSTVTETINVICMDTNISQQSPSLKEMIITINLMCHKENLEITSSTKSKYRKLGYIGNRLDIAVAILNDIIGHSRKFGIGELRPVPRNPVQPYFPNNDFFGKTLTYTCTDFMTDYGKRAGEAR